MVSQGHRAVSDRSQRILKRFFIMPKVHSTSFRTDPTLELHGPMAVPTVELAKAQTNAPHMK